MAIKKTVLSKGITKQCIWYEIMAKIDLIPKIRNNIKFTKKNFEGSHISSFDKKDDITFF